jgi:hypothetical protein
LEPKVATKLQPRELERVVVLDGEVHINDFVDTDPTLHRVLVEAAEPEEMTHTILRIGAQASLVAQADLDARVVERAFDALNAQFDASLTDAVESISGKTTELLDDEGGRLPSFLRSLESRLAEQFEALFDEDSKSSALAAMTRVFEQFAAERGYGSRDSPRNSSSPWSTAASSSSVMRPKTRLIRRLSMDRRWSMSAYDVFVRPLFPGDRRG